MKGGGTRGAGTKNIEPPNIHDDGVDRSQIGFVIKPAQTDYLLVTTITVSIISVSQHFGAVGRVVVAAKVTARAFHLLTICPQDRQA